MQKNIAIVLFAIVVVVFINAYPVLGNNDLIDEQSVYQPLPGENENTFIDNHSTLEGNSRVYQELPGEPGDSFSREGKLKNEEATQEYDSALGLLPGEEIHSFNAQGKLIDEGSTNEDVSVVRELPGKESKKDYTASGKLVDDNATDDKSVPPAYTDKD